MGQGNDHAAKAAASRYAFSPDKTLKYATIGLFLIAFTACLYIGRDFFLPVTIAFILALTLGRFVRRIARSWLPAFIPALIVVSALSFALGTAAYVITTPLDEMIRSGPTIERLLRERLIFLKAPVEAVEAAQDRVEKLTSSRSSKQPQALVVRGPNLLTEAASGIANAVVQIVVTVVLLIFLLSSGDLFYRKLVNVSPRLNDKKRALRIVHEIEHEVSRYLLTISVINIALGLVITATLWSYGMPKPHVWGILATFLNFIPYIGAVLGTLMIAIAALMHFELLVPALGAAGIYYLCTFIEGQFVTPMAVGKRLEVNPVVVFLSVAFWAWLWGIFGALIAVPLLVILKSFASQFPSMIVLAEFLASADVSQEGGVSRHKEEE